MKNPETRHIIASIALCAIGIFMLATANLAGVIMPSEILPGETAGQVVMGSIGLTLFFSGGFYAFIRMGVIYYSNPENKLLT